MWVPCRRKNYTALTPCPWIEEHSLSDDTKPNYVFPTTSSIFKPSRRFNVIRTFVCWRRDVFVSKTIFKLWLISTPSRNAPSLPPVIVRLLILGRYEPTWLLFWIWIFWIHELWIQSGGQVVSSCVYIWYLKIDNGLFLLYYLFL